MPPVLFRLALLPLLLLGCAGKSAGPDGCPVAVWTPGALAWADLRAGEPAAASLSLLNNCPGETPLAVDASVEGSAFSLDLEQLHLAPGSSWALTVRAQTADYAGATGTLTLATSDPAAPLIEIPLTAALDPDQDGDGVAYPDDCGDADADSYPGATETWYDGVDQDCDGNDDDADGDGWAVADDCDDERPFVYPGAAEIWYDGIDQGCDGGSDDDADGDGWAIEEDCDDADAGVNPAVALEVSDGRDQDCDGRVDETLVCQDGSGDFLTVQEAVDAAGSAQSVEICPGVYDEPVQWSNRQIELVGVGEEPGDVVIAADVSPLLVRDDAGASDNELSLQNLALQGSGAGLEISGFRRLLVERVDFCGSDGIAASGAEASAQVLYSRFCGGYSSIYTTNEAIEIAYNLFEEGSSIYAWYYEDIDLHFHHNLLVGGTLGVYTDRAVIEHNTWVDSQKTPLYVISTNCESYPSPCAEAYSTVFLTQNIFSNIEHSGGLVYYDVSFAESIDTAPLATYHPKDYTGNLLWNVEDPYFYLHYTSSDDYWDYDEWIAEETSFSDTFAAASILEDPLFSYVDGRGSYAPDPLGPAADLGAFGGAEGLWWQDFPFPLP